MLRHMQQLSLISDPVVENSAYTKAARSDRFADVYIATLKGGGGRRIMRMAPEHARLLCSRSETAGFGRGGPWALFWTQHGVDDYDLDQFEIDDGRFDELMARLGIQVVFRRQRP